MMNEDIDIDVDFSFTDDTPDYWKKFDAQNSSRDCLDPDRYSSTLRSYHKKLWSRLLPCKDKMELKENVGDYLIWKDFRFGADSIVNMYFHSITANKYYLSEEIKKYLCNNANEDSKFNDFIAFYKNYLKKSYTIGGSIIFPKTNSINVARGTSLKDRFDLTLECIRLYYLGEKSPLFDKLKANKPFFDLFIDFKGYVDFFYLNDLVTDNYSAIKYFNSCTDITKATYPSSAEDWLALYKNQLAFVKNRNNRIKNRNQ